MFKSARWRSEKNKVKFVFKLQFHAAKVPQIGDDALMISIVPADVGKTTVKSDKALVRDGSCFWDNPTYEPVKFNRDPKSGKIHEKIYYFVVGTGSSKSGVIGEASIDFSNYAETSKVSMVSLPLKCSNMEAVLNVSIQRMQDFFDYRGEENESTKSDYKEHSSKAQLDNGDGTIKSNSDDPPFNKSVFNITEPNGTCRASSGSDITILSSESDNVHHEWLRDSPLEAASTYDSLSTLREEAFLGHHLSEEPPNVIIEKLKSEVAALSRQGEMSELELQTLRKQIVKESKKGQDLSKELVCLKEERDALKGEYEKVKIARTKTDLQFQGGGDCWEIVQELRQELNHVKEINANLQIQLQKTQESNSELILAVRDLDEMLETKSKEILELPDGLLPKDVDEKKPIEVGSTYKQDNDDHDDEEQKALEELVKEHGDAKEAYLLEQQIIDLRGEIEIYKRDKDELEMQMEQLALDYEIMKQENHEMAYKLEQSELQEQLKMQYECSSSYNTVQELETHIENLENELKKRSEESENACAKISDLEDHVKYLEEELEKQSQDFEADLEALMGFKVEQEQRAIKAEEALRKIKWQNANTAERLQDEFKRLYVQMTSTFEVNEKLAAKAVAEANDLHLQKSRLEEIIKKASEEQKLVKGLYETRLHQLSDQVRLMTNQIEKMQLEIEEKEIRLENQKKLEFEMCMEKNKILSDEIGNKETLMDELEQMRISIKDMELLSGESKDEKIELQKRIMLAKSDAEEYQKELNKMRCIMEEKELLVEKVQSELESLQLQCTELKRTLSEDELEKGILRKQLGLLKGDLKKRDDALNNMEKKMLHGSEEGANLKERIMFLEDEIKSKENALKALNNAFLDKEKGLHNESGEIEGRLEVVDQRSNHYCVHDVKKAAALVDEQGPNFRSTEETRNSDDDTTNLKMGPAISLSSDNEIRSGLKCYVDNHGHLDELTNEMARLKERNKLMEAELNEMQERYSEISVKFAEVEGERQQLIMEVRNLKNAKTTS